mmetsp:Transcript_20383/g.60145  ORF Transcript_20383/g.60145 Transcript_20383/m.60145 type:complete len:267 (+) Transcript_20383:389-1189(+)
MSGAECNAAARGAESAWTASRREVGAGLSSGTPRMALAFSTQPGGTAPPRRAWCLSLRFCAAVSLFAEWFLSSLSALARSARWSGLSVGERSARCRSMASCSAAVGPKTKATSGVATSTPSSLTLSASATSAPPPSALSASARACAPASNDRFAEARDAAAIVPRSARCSRVRLSARRATAAPTATLPSSWRPRLRMGATSFAPCAFKATAESAQPEPSSAVSSVASIGAQSGGRPVSESSASVSDQSGGMPASASSPIQSGSCSS